MRREFTGRDMAKVLVAGFGVVVVVNFTMATLASRSFSGVVVDNSYVASQKFNGWLEEARAAESLGWDARIERLEGGYLGVATQGVPSGAAIIADLRRPLGERETRQLEFSQVSPGEYRSTGPAMSGRWIARITIESGEHSWTSEVPIE